MYNKSEIVKSLKKIGIKKGDNLFINPEIFKLGIYDTKKNFNNFYQDYFDSLMNVIGKTGTLCINTYTFDTLRFNKRFVYESSSTTSGKLSNLFLKQNKTIRSLHPVFSVAAIGKNANYICNLTSEVITTFGGINKLKKNNNQMQPFVINEQERDAENKLLGLANIALEREIN